MLVMETRLSPSIAIPPAGLVLPRGAGQGCEIVLVGDGSVNPTHASSVAATGSSAIPGRHGGHCIRIELSSAPAKPPIVVRPGAWFLTRKLWLRSADIYGSSGVSVLRSIAGFVLSALTGAPLSPPLPTMREGSGVRRGYDNSGSRDGRGRGGALSSRAVCATAVERCEPRTPPERESGAPSPECHIIAVAAEPRRSDRFKNVA
jgi:hypothetical protein